MNTLRPTVVKIVFQNEFFCCVYKPAGFLSVPSRLGEGDPRPVIGRLLQAQLSTQIWPCHRLDEDVSGLLLFALSAGAHRAANQWFESKMIKKTYQALAMSLDSEIPSHEVQIWTCLLAKGKKRAYEAEFGKEAITEARYKGQTDNGQFEQWTLLPRTGRSHQLRFEMMRHERPIVGDSLYGSKDRFADGGVALRAVKLDFSECQNASSFKLPSILEIGPELSFFHKI